MEVYARYLAAERRSRNPDLFVMSGVYERAIAEAAKRRFAGEIGAEEALRSFWVGYCDALVCLCGFGEVWLDANADMIWQRINDAGEEAEREALKRATRSVPGSGEVLARYLRHLVRKSLSHFDGPVIIWYL